MTEVGLIVCTWRNENELWETVYAKDGEQDLDFRPFRTDGSHRPTFCVWEPGAVCHEQKAWSGFLVSSRDVAAKEIYLQDSYEGLV